MSATTPAALPTITIDQIADHQGAARVLPTNHRAPHPDLISSVGNAITSVRHRSHELAVVAAPDENAAALPSHVWANVAERARTTPDTMRAAFQQEARKALAEALDLLADVVSDEANAILQVATLQHRAATRHEQQLADTDDNERAERAAQARARHHVTYEIEKVAATRRYRAPTDMSATQLDDLRTVATLNPDVRTTIIEQRCTYPAAWVRVSPNDGTLTAPQRIVRACLSSPQHTSDTITVALTQLQRNDLPHH